MESGLLIEVAYGCGFMVEVDEDDIDGVVDQVAAMNFVRRRDQNDPIGSHDHLSTDTNCQIREGFDG